ncbi:glycoside hydrolase family 5 protein [Streptacidiphilus monticola]
MRHRRSPGPRPLRHGRLRDLAAGQPRGRIRRRGRLAGRPRRPFLGGRRRTLVHRRRPDAPAGHRLGRRQLARRLPDGRLPGHLQQRTARPRRRPGRRPGPAPGPAARGRRRDRLLRHGRTRVRRGPPRGVPHAYGYENEDDYSYLADQGVSLVRLSVSWERLQPVPFHALDATEVQRVRDSVYAAQRHGLLVLLDLHGYGDFAAGGGRGTLRLGSPALPTGALADFWRRAVTALPPVYGYDLLNEPQHLAATGTAGARLWESASRQAADAIRAAHGHGLLVVAGYGDAQPGAWGRLHPAPWISDPLDRVAYDAHAYFDSDGSGRYAASYPRELTLAQQAGGGPTRSCLPLSAFDASDAQDRTQP